MTSNNEVKAPRPCTLWGQTFDSNKFLDIIVFQDTVSIGCGQFDMPTSEPTTDIHKTTMEAVLAIASAQRPWLKAEGFQFIEGKVYWVKNKLDETFLLCKHEHGEFTPCWSDGTFIRERFAIPSFLERHIPAFKPISDSQEAWDAVARVEVYKESTNDTQTNG